MSTPTKTPRAKRMARPAGDAAHQAPKAPRTKKIIAIDPAKDGAFATAEVPATPKAPRAPKAPKAATEPRVTKGEQVLAMMRSPEGATTAELIALTGWLPHTMRAAITGLRKKGNPIMTAKSAKGETLYLLRATIAEAAEPTGEGPGALELTIEPEAEGMPGTE